MALATWLKIRMPLKKIREISDAGAPVSIRRILTGWLVWPLAALILASTIPTYFLALNAANDAYDSALLDPVLAVATHISKDEERITVDLPQVALDALRIDSRDRVFIQVRGPKNEIIAGNLHLPPPPADIPPAGFVYYDARLQDDRLRVAALHVPHALGPVVVQAAETYVKRDKIVLDILLASILAELVISLAALWLVWHGIGRGLAPLEQLRDDIAVRSPQDLRPVLPDGKPSELVPIINAINRLLGRLKSSIDGQQRFIANAAHQLRTPLAGLKTHAELALRQPSTAELRSLLEMIAGETGRTSHMVNQLLTLARAEPEEPGGSHHDPVNLHEISARAVQEWVPRALAKNVDMGFELQDAWTYGEPLLMRELLANLLENSLAYTQSGGSITVRTEEREGRAAIEVEDNGRGIPEDERERVFERFYRAKGTPGDGCGLGLAIVREIASRHHGWVEIKTPASHQGTLIRVEFPRMAREASSESTGRKSARSTAR